MRRFALALAVLVGAWVWVSLKWGSADDDPLYGEFPGLDEPIETRTLLDELIARARAAASRTAAPPSV